MPFHLAVALDGAGWHPAAWREPGARADELFTAGYWADLVPEAERGLLDFVTIEDALGLQSPAPATGRRTDQVRGRLDAVLIAARVAPADPHIGLVPTVDRHPHRAVPRRPRRSPPSTTSAPGRAGLRIQVVVGDRGRGTRCSAAATRDDSRGVADLFDEAADYVEVVAPALGQLGGRRRDPRRRHRPVRRPRQAALHRLRGPRTSRVQGPVDHAAPAAGPAGGHRARARRRRRTGSPPAAPTSVRHRRTTPTTARPAIVGEIRAEPARPGARRRPAARLRRPGGVPRRRPPTPPRPPGPARRLAGGRVRAATPAIFAGTPAELADLLAGVAAARA